MRDSLQFLNPLPQLFQLNLKLPKHFQLRVRDFVVLQRFDTNPVYADDFRWDTDSGCVRWHGLDNH
jgi:hypothetical protein